MLYVKYISAILIKGQGERKAKPSRSLPEVAHPPTHLEKSFFPLFKEAVQAHSCYSGYKLSQVSARLMHPSRKRADV